MSARSETRRAVLHVFRRERAVEQVSSQPANVSRLEPCQRDMTEALDHNAQVAAIVASLGFPHPRRLVVRQKDIADVAGERVPGRRASPAWRECRPLESK
jgi:hypothetical protein